MSVATTTSKIQYTLTTGSQALSIPFYFLDNAHIKAVTVATETLPSITLVLGTDYTLTGAANPAGGTLTTIATVGNGLAAGSKVVIKRNVPITQPTSYSPNDAFPAKVHEGALDRGIMIAQQSDEQSDRAIRFPEDDSRESVLPSAVDRALKALVFDANGDATVSATVDADGIVTPGSVGETSLEGAFRERSEVSVSAMKARSYSGAVNNQRINLLGYYAVGDGGGQLLYIDKTDTTTAEGGGKVFVATDGTRLKSVDTDVGNILRAGAKTDGTDATSAIVATLAAFAGRRVHFPRGNYRVVTSNIAIPGRTTIFGDGPETTNIYYRTASTSANALFTADNVDNIRIDSITLYNDTSGGGNSSTAIKCDGAMGTVSDIVLNRVNIDGFQTSGLYLFNVNYCTITRCRFINCSNKAANGGTGSGLASAIRVSGVVNGVYVSTGTRFEANDMILTGGTVPMYSWTFRDSFFERNGNAVSPATSDVAIFSAINGLVFEGNYCEANLTGSGGSDSFLRMNGCRGVSVRGNMIESKLGGVEYTKNLLRFDAACRGASVENNYLANPITRFIVVDGSGPAIKAHRNTWIESDAEVTTYAAIAALLSYAYVDFDIPLLTTFAPGSLANLAANAVNVTVDGARVGVGDSVKAIVDAGGADIVTTASILSDGLVRVTVLNVKGSTYDPGTLNLVIRVTKGGL